MKQRHRWLVGVLVAVALAVLVLIAPGEEGAIAQGGILYVDAGAEGANDGSSWTDALVDLQDALDMAGLGVQIRVAAGTYKPTHEFTAGDPRSASFQMMNGVEIYGGFDPTAGATEWEDRDWVLHETILSGDIGFAGDSSDNSYHILYNPGGTGLDGSAVLDGFTITGGNADNLDLYPHFYGGGMYNYASSPTLSNCTFENNSSAYVGGGMAIGWYSAPTLTNCTFRGNSAGSEGGGIYNWDYSSPVLNNCTFEANSANDGGGMYNAYWASPTLTNCVFDDNSATYRGGGMYNWYESLSTLINCTFWGNTAGQEGGGIHNNNSTPEVTNSILWGDSPQEIANSDLFLSPLVSYSNVQGGHPGEGNINADPLFLDAGGGDYHLRPGSPCIDAGNPDASNLPPYDFEGDDRVGDGDGDGTPIVDMGVDEFYQAPPPPVIFVDADAEGANTGLSWADAFTTLQSALAWAADGVEIWVAEGTYTPTAEHGGSGDRYRSFQMKNGVAIYGGFDPSVGHTEWEDRDWLAHPTILSGDLDGDDGPNFENNDENSYHVFYHPEEYTDLDSSAILDGFTISGGNADGVSHTMMGGGMQNYFSSPTLTNCTFSSNWANYGGGMFNGYSSPMLDNCTFSGNSAGGVGGGMLNSEEKGPTLTNCTFSDNSAGDEGGGMHNHDASPTLTNCSFYGNSAGSNGGGMLNRYSSPTLTNCIFWGNSAGWGGGILSDPSDIDWPVLTNCILWDNSPNQIWDDGDSPVTYSDIQGGYTGGEGNIDADPLFVDPDNGDFHLGEGSPCIDAGSNNAPNLPLYDFEGDDRILDGDRDGAAIVDMGVDEVVYAGPPVVIVEIDIRPGSDQNVINLGSGGVVPVAILTTIEFDASTVRPGSVRFAGAAARRWTLEDVDRDGDLDLLLNFRIQELDLDETSTEATLTGETFPHAGGVLIKGTDMVRIIL